MKLFIQNLAFLALKHGVELSIAILAKKIGFRSFQVVKALFYRSFQVMVLPFAEFDGHVIEYELQPGQQIVIDTGHLAAMTATCQMDIQTVPGIKNMFLGGEGLFNTVVTGPGHVWLQTMPISNMAGALIPYLPTTNK